MPFRKYFAKRKKKVPRTLIWQPKSTHLHDDVQGTKHNYFLQFCKCVFLLESADEIRINHNTTSTLWQQQCLNVLTRLGGRKKKDMKFLLYVMWVGPHKHNAIIKTADIRKLYEIYPFIRNLSLTSIRWGEVKSPVRKPHSRRIASQNVHVEP